MFCPSTVTAVTLNLKCQKSSQNTAQVTTIPVEMVSTTLESDLVSEFGHENQVK